MYYTSKDPPFDIGELKWRMYCLLLGSINKNRTQTDKRYLKYLKYIYRNSKERSWIISELNRYMEYFEENFNEYENKFSYSNDKIHIMIFEYVLVLLNGLKLLLSSGVLIPDDDVTCLSLGNKNIYVINTKDDSDAVYKVTAPSIAKYEEILEINTDGIVRYGSIEIGIDYIDLDLPNDENHTNRVRDSFDITTIDNDNKVYTTLGPVIIDFLEDITRLYIESIRKL